MIVCGTHYEDSCLDKEKALDQAAKLQAKIHNSFSSSLASIEWALVSTHTGEGISFLRNIIHKTVCRYGEYVNSLIFLLGNLNCERQFLAPIHY